MALGGAGSIVAFLQLQAASDLSLHLSLIPSLHHSPPSCTSPLQAPPSLLPESLRLPDPATLRLAGSRGPGDRRSTQQHEALDSDLVIVGHRFGGFFVLVFFFFTVDFLKLYLRERE